MSIGNPRIYLLPELFSLPDNQRLSSEARVLSSSKESIICYVTEAKDCQFESTKKAEPFLDPAFIRMGHST